MMWGHYKKNATEIASAETLLSYYPSTYRSKVKPKFASFTGFTEFYSALPSLNEFYWVLPSLLGRTYYC